MCKGRNENKVYGVGKVFDTTEVGAFAPELVPTKELKAGDVGYIAASIKNVADTRVGDTVTDDRRPAAQALPGYKKDHADGILRHLSGRRGQVRRFARALEKLQLNDASLLYDPEVSVALGLASAAGSSGCCIWRLSKSGWNANSILIL